MNFCKSILLSLTVIVTFLSPSLSAFTVEELDLKIRTAKACLVPIELLYEATPL